MKKEWLLFLGLLVLNLFLVSSLDSYGNVSYYTQADADNISTFPGGHDYLVRDKIIKTGAAIGEWTHDINAARALARVNGVPLIINFGREACQNCIAAREGIYSRPEFKKWAKDNKFAMVYADYGIGNCLWGMGGIDYSCPYTTREVITLYRWATIFPMLILVDEKDGKSPMGGTLAVSTSYFGTYMNGNGRPATFISLVETMMNKKDDLLVRNDSAAASARYPVVLNMNSPIKDFNLYNQYGQNGLMVEVNQVAGSLLLKYGDLVDWYMLANLTYGSKYFIRAINVSDSENFGKVSFYSGLDNAKNNISFKEITLNEFKSGYQFTASGNQDIYMKIWMNDMLSKLQVAGSGDSPYRVVNISESDLGAPDARGFRHYIGRSEFNLTYNLEYGQGEVVISQENQEHSGSSSEDLDIEDSEGSMVSRTISDFIGLFSGWFSSSEKLNISYSGAVAGEWTTDYDSAKELSIVNNRPMILLFGKSLNEKYSTEVINKVLKSEAWREYAKAKGIPLVFVDFSNSSSLSQEAIRLYPQENSSIVKLPTLLYLNLDQELLGVCVYRKGTNCNGINVGVNVTNFVEVLESYTGEIYDLGSDMESDLNTEIDCSDGSCSIGADNIYLGSENTSIIENNFVGNVTFNINWSIVSHLAGNGTRGLDYGIYSSPNIGVYGGFKPRTNGSEAGKWTTDLVAARNLAKQNDVFYIVMVTRIPGCSYCSAADNAIFEQPEFVKWAVDNKIPLVYASAPTGPNPEPTSTILSLYPGLSELPQIYVIDGSTDSINLINKFVLREGLWGNFGALTPQNFVKKIQSVVENYSLQQNISSNNTARYSSSSKAK